MVTHTASQTCARQRSVGDETGTLWQNQDLADRELCNTKRDSDSPPAGQQADSEV